MLFIDKENSLIKTIKLLSKLVLMQKIEFNEKNRI